MVVFNAVTVQVRNQTSGIDPVGQTGITKVGHQLAGKINEAKGGIKGIVNTVIFLSRGITSNLCVILKCNFLP